MPSGVGYMRGTAIYESGDLRGLQRQRKEGQDPELGPEAVQLRQEAQHGLRRRSRRPVQLLIEQPALQEAVRLRRQQPQDARHEGSQHPGSQQVVRR